MFRLKVIDEIPEAVLKAIELSSYESKPGRYGVTTLLKPTQMTILGRRHKDQITETPDEQIWRLFGSAFHHILEMGGEALAKEQGVDVLQHSEQYVKIEILERIVGGVIDLHVDDESINDYKVTNAWSVIRQDTVDDWTWQLNMYRYMMWKDTGKEIKNLRIVAFFRNWDKKETLRSQDYPRKKLMVYELDLIPLQEVEHFMFSKIDELVRSESLPDDQLPPCTAQEMWQRDTEYAVYKDKKVKGIWEEGKRAARVLPTEEQAQAYIDTATLKPSELLRIAVRPGRRIKCEGVFDGGETYCPVSHICPQHQAYLASKGKGNNAKETVTRTDSDGSTAVRGCDKTTCGRCNLSGKATGGSNDNRCSACRESNSPCQCGK